MRQLLIIILIGMIQNSFAQDVRFQFIRVSKCDNLERIDSGLYYLSNLVTDFDTTYQSINGTVTLPDTGRYEIYVYEEPDTEFEPVHIKETGLFKYKYYEPRIILRYYGMHGNRVYEECGIPIEGFKEDFYPNGKIRIRGNFVKGKPEDSLITFHESGAIEKRITYLKKEIKIEEFDTLSNLIRLSHNSNKSYFLTDYKSKDYYANGTIKKIELRKNNMTLIKRYYQNGALEINQSKKNRFEYYESGKMKYSYTWKKKRDRIIRGEYAFDYRITKLLYDETGKVVEKIIYEEWNSYQPQPNLEITESDWIIYWAQVRENSETIITEDIDPDVYFKSNN